MRINNLKNKLNNENFGDSEDSSDSDSEIEIPDDVNDLHSELEDENTNNKLKIIGIGFVLWGCWLYLYDSTPFGMIFTILPWFERDFDSYSLNLGLKKNNTGNLGSVGLLDGSSPEDDIPDDGSPGDMDIPGLNKYKRLTGGSEKSTIFSNFSIPSVFSLIIIFIGIIIVLRGYKNEKAESLLIACPILYSLGFIFIIASIQESYKQPGEEKFPVYSLSIGIIFIITGIIIHAIRIKIVVDDHEKDKKSQLCAKINSDYSNNVEEKKKIKDKVSEKFDIRCGD